MERGSQDPQIITTKLAIPPYYLKKIIPRDHVYMALDAGLQRPLLLVTAPAGFGKTTVVSEWIRQRQLPAAWVSLDPSDNDIVRFWRYILTALSRFLPELNDLISSCQGGQGGPGIETILTRFINSAITLSEDIVLVLDDYHTICTPVIHQSVTFLLEHLPPRLHVVLITRRDPPLPLARLRVQGKLVELRTQDLRFTDEETGIFLTQAMNLNLSLDDTIALRKHTEGWIAGLQLAALSLQGRSDNDAKGSMAQFLKSFSGINRNILHYLTDEVLQQLPEHIQTFLLQTSILERLNASLCNAVTGNTDGEMMLEWLEQNNLFLNALDHQQYWYRYDQLFLELLQHRLKQKYPTLLPELHHRAATWYAQQGMDIDVIKHAILAEDMELAVRLIEQHACHFIQRGEDSLVRMWLSSLPEALIASHPMLSLLQAYTAFLQARMDVYEQALTRATRLWQKDKQHRYMLGRVYDLRARVALYCGDGPQVIKYARQTLAFIDEDSSSPFYCSTMLHLGAGHLLQGELVQAAHYLSESYRLGQKYSYTTVALAAGVYHGLLQKAQGNLRTAIQTFQQICGEAQTIVSWPVIAAHVYLADIYRERNEVTNAQEHIQQARLLSLQAADEGYMAAELYLVQARLTWLQEEHEQAMTLLIQAEHSSQRFGPNPTFLARVAELRMHFLLARRDLTTARQWQTQYAPPLTDDMFLYEREYWLMTQARLLIAQEQGQQAVQLLEPAYQLAHQQGRSQSELELLLLLTLAYHIEGNTQHTLQKLEQALLLGEAGAYMRSFVDEGAVMIALLTELYSRYQRHSSAETIHSSPGYIYTLLSSVGTETQPPRWLISQENEDEMIDKLSEREYMVLALIAEGLSNQEIAQKLVVTVSTIKTHLNNIYAKLHVHTRLQAVTRAYDLGVLRRSEVDTEPLSPPRPLP
ncbi:LuxR C-terminal-related transcriptional regulator [Dictyobacter aurantiacus]|uniref:LuxR family transcriptional regulator n=1 Tax=Dictyobacter aurantiacus TaxID=1936993 RepID=A0A401ZE72_9CHLR|nr:LuxR C-terminal-related transcriptional regulator [Dictyobacter aurantiacus]GCE05180.1 LuxR family transcriptional regulator [Dictyobacter aurantiacus]